MIEINTTTDAMLAIAAAIRERSLDDLNDLEEQIELWIFGEDERDAWTALLRAAEAAIVNQQ